MQPHLEAEGDGGPFGEFVHDVLVLDATYLLVAAKFGKGRHVEVPVEFAERYGPHEVLFVFREKVRFLLETVQPVRAVAIFDPGLANRKWWQDVFPDAAAGRFGGYKRGGGKRRRFQVRPSPLPSHRPPPRRRVR